MAQLYTKSNLIQFLYQELDLFDKLEMEFAMDEDSTLMEYYAFLKEGYDTLPEVTFSPKKTTINRILEYSK
ncbi:MAG: hypothetical protein LC107_05840 [Chitinophagales bacterium]|nr:hypothetical protein [Chitinophagales bacterium]